MKDELGDRMKEKYENIFRHKLPGRTNTIIRLDGKAFHSYLKFCKIPYDIELMNDMDLTAIYLCENIMGAKMAYVQSDEISILLTDYDSINTEAWFGGNIQKMTSISASLATAKFNQLRLARACYQADLEYPIKSIEKDQVLNETLALFDSRCFVIPQDFEVHNYFVFRQKDAIRNSIQMAGQANFSSKQLNGVNCEKIKEKLNEIGKDWEDTPPGFKYGRVIHKTYYEVENPNNPDEKVLRSKWELDENYPIFTESKDYIKSILPQ